MKITILGSGGSGGVPLVGGNWGRCDPNEPRNRRRRPSLLVEHGDATILIDTSPDCREQLLDAGVQRLDAVLYTHAHADHSHGLDDLRWINYAMQADLPVLSDALTYGELQRRFAYAFEPLEHEAGGYYYRPALIWREILIERFAVAGVEVVPFEQDHGFSKTLGFRIGDIAYSPDVVRLDEAALKALEGVKVWIVDCLREAEHPTHANLAQVLQWRERVGPERTILTHMNHTLDYATLKAKCPAGVEPAFDGMQVDLLSYIYGGTF